MADDTKTDFPTVAGRNLAEEDKRRQGIEERRQKLHRRLSQAFAVFSNGSHETELAQNLREFLAFVYNNIDAYRTKTRVQNPNTGEFFEAEWVALCGASIQAIQAPPRIVRLVFEVVVGLIPPDELIYRQKLAEAAGMDLRARVSADNLRSLQKKGIMAAFAGKLLVDSKNLVATATVEEAEAYFDAAAKIAGELHASPYHTERDRRFLRLCRQRYQGGPEALVATQREAALEEIAERETNYPQLEAALRSLLENPFLSEGRRTIEDWFIAAQIAFHSESYVYARLDEFRERVKIRLGELERQRLLNPEAAMQQASGALHKIVDRFVKQVARAGHELVWPAPHSLDVFQIVRQNVAILDKKGVVELFNDFMDEEQLAESYAQYKVAVFQKEEPDLRAKLKSDLFIWDEIFRSAPLTTAQKIRLQQAKVRLLDSLKELGHELDADLLEKPILSPFAGAILPALKTEEEFRVFGDWLDRVRRMFDEAPKNEGEGAIADQDEEITLQLGNTDPMGTPDKLWRPTLIDTGEFLQPAPPPDQAPGKDRATRQGWFRSLFGRKTQ